MKNKNIEEYFLCKNGKIKWLFLDEKIFKSDYELNALKSEMISLFCQVKTVSVRDYDFIKICLKSN